MIIVSHCSLSGLRIKKTKLIRLNSSHKLFLCALLDVIYIHVNTHTQLPLELHLNVYIFFSLINVVAAIFLGMDLPGLDLPGPWKTYAMIGFVAWHVGTEIVLEIHAYRLSRKGNQLKKLCYVESLLSKLLEHSFLNTNVDSYVVAY